MNKVKEAVEFEPIIVGKFDKEDNQLYYNTSWFCNENKIIHPNIKSYLNCKSCISQIDKMEYEALQRLNFLIDGYFIHNLGGGLFTKLSTEEVCKTYNVDIKFFRPWL